MTWTRFCHNKHFNMDHSMEKFNQTKMSTENHVAAILFIANLFYLFHWFLLSSWATICMRCSQRQHRQRKEKKTSRYFSWNFCCERLLKRKGNCKIPFCHFSWLLVANATKWIHKVHVLMLRMWRQFECIHLLCSLFCDASAVSRYLAHWSTSPN